MPTYRVKPGYRHGLGKKYGPGDEVELTEFEAAGFLDKLERVQLTEPAPRPTVSESGLVVSPARTEPSEPTPETQTEPTFDVIGATVSEALAAVDAGRIEAATALAAEQASIAPRVSLIRELERRIDAD